MPYFRNKHARTNICSSATRNSSLGANWAHMRCQRRLPTLTAGHHTSTGLYFLICQGDPSCILGEDPSDVVAESSVIKRV